MISLLVIFQKEHWQLGSMAYRLLLYLSDPTSPQLEQVFSIACIILDVWYFFYVCGSNYIALHINLEYMHTFKTAVLLVMGGQMKVKCHNHISGRFNLLQSQLRIYTKLRLITTVYNGVYGKYFVPTTKTFCGLIVVQSVFISVRLAGKSGLIVTLFGLSCSLIGITCLALFITFMAMVHDHSMKLKDYLRKKQFIGGLERRLVKGFRVEAVKSGGMYPIERETCLTVLGLISNMCGSALLSFKF